MAEPDEYDKVELPALEQLQRLGWTYVPGPDLSPESSSERQAYYHVVLQQRLSTAIQRINPWISDENLRKVVRDLRFQGVEHPTLIETNQTVWETLVQYISVEQDLGKGRRGQTVRIIDFDNPDNNEFLCVNQFKVEGPSQNIIPDITVIQGHGDGTHPIAGERHRYRFQRVGQQPCDPIALLHPRRTQARRDLSDVLVQFGVSDAPIT